MKTRTQQIEELQKEWTQPRWEGIRRPYSAEEVVKLRGSVNPECTLAQLGAAKMWRLLHGDAKKGYINSLGALTAARRCNRRKRALRRSICPAGRWRRTLTWPPACTRISRCTRQTLFRRSWIGSTTLSVVRIRSSGRPALTWRSALCRLLPADRCRCGGRFWRRTERV